MRGGRTPAIQHFYSCRLLSGIAIDPVRNNNSGAVKSMCQPQWFQGSLQYKPGIFTGILFYDVSRLKYPELLGKICFRAQILFMKFGKLSTS